MKCKSLVIAFIVTLLLLYSSLVVFAQRTGAICADGTTSSATGRGACSHHGGVAQWITSEPEATPTFTPEPTAILLPTATPTPVLEVQTKKTDIILQPTSVVTATTAISDTSAVVLQSANLRAGPGTSYPIIGAAVAGQVVTIVGQNDDSSWYHLAGGEWIAAFLVNMDAAQSTAANGNSDSITKTYVENAKNAIALFVDGSSIVEAQFRALRVDTNSYYDKAWKTSMATGLAELTLCVRTIRKSTPPADMVEMNADFLSAADHLENAVNLWISGISQLDVDKVKNAGEEYKLANTAIMNAKAKFDTVAGDTWGQ